MAKQTKDSTPGKSKTAVDSDNKAAKAKTGDATAADGGKTKYLKGSRKADEAHDGDCAAVADAENRETLKQFENDLNKREVGLIEREIKSLRLQEEVDRLRPLSGLYRVVKAMATERRLDSLLHVITRETAIMLKCDRCTVWVLDHSRHELWTQVAQGLDQEHKTIRIPLHGTSISSECARTSAKINIPDAYSDPRFDKEVDKQTGYHTNTILCVPMLNRVGEVIGVFQVLNKVGGPFTNDDEDWLEGLTAVSAGLIEQAQAYDELERFAEKTLETLAQTIDKRDQLTAGHSMRVTSYSVLLGKQMEVADHDIDVLRYSALLHDYGKIGVPESILWKDGRLTPEEYAEVQKHASYTYELLINLPFTKRLEQVPYIASCHHEKIDGTGYYRGLKGEQIPFLSRIIAVADVFDALTSKRHYRNRMEIEKVSEIMLLGRDQHFEAECVDAFYRLPASKVLRVMESERGQAIPPEIEIFKEVSWRRIIELMAGSHPRRGEDELVRTFNRIYNAGLPADYKPLD